MAAVFSPPNPADNDCADAQYDKDTGLQAVHFFHQPVGIACAIFAQINQTGTEISAASPSIRMKRV